MRTQKPEPKLLERHVQQLRRCRACSGMTGPVVSGGPVLSKVMLIGQAPGVKEGLFGKPFAWTAGKTLFKWFASIGLSEEEFRSRVYMAAVCRCFPGKNPKGGDRVPAPAEIEACKKWLDAEFSLLKPELVIPVGRLAIEQVLGRSPLDAVVGKVHRVEIGGLFTDCIPLPHPSGASTWHRMEPGKTLLLRALKLIKAHPSFQAIANLVEG